MREEDGTRGKDGTEWHVVIFAVNGEVLRVSRLSWQPLKAVEKEKKKEKDPRLCY